jgi:uncharacterized protein YjbJ (UPF0337 family)
MQGDVFRGKWHEVKGKVRQKWGKLTHNDIEEINGRREELLGKLQSRYGWQERQAEEELNRFERSLQGEKGQKISAEYERDEDTETSPDRERHTRNEETSETSERKTGKGNKTEKYNREYFERSDEEEKGSGEEDQGRKRKVR